MRTFLLAAAAAAPIAFAAAPALAQTSVTAGTSTPLATSTAGNIDVTSTGSISPTTATPAITVDSDNTVSIEGSVATNNVNNATGVLLLGGHTGALTVTGPITMTEDFTASDTTNSDGIIEAPLSQGTGRYGVRSTGTSAFNGNVGLNGAITVKGNASYGVSLEAPLNGALAVTGGVSLTGDNGVGVQELGGVTGAVQLGSITTTGAASRSAVLGGDIGGALRLTGVISTTGYTNTVRQVDTAQQKIQATPADVNQSGAGVTVAGSVAGGVYLSGAPSGTVSGTLADVDGDGVADGAEASGSLLIYGSAPALLVGGAGKAITLGAFGTGDNAYGVLLRSTVTASGIYDKVTATAIQLGVPDAGSTVNIAGGLRDVGAISATTYEADATGIHVLAGVTAPELRFDLGASVVSSILDSTLITTPTTATSSAILIDAGANVGKLTNYGTISATAVGDAMGAVAVRDRSGTLSNVLNEGVIVAATSATTAGAISSGGRVALDLSQNTTGVTLVQQTNPNPNTQYGSTSGTADVATTANTAVTPSITGDVLLGNGPNTVNIANGTLTGALSLGSGANSSLTIGNGASVIGAVTYGGPSLALSVNGTLDNSSATTMNLSSLNIGSTGKVYFAVDGANALSTRLVSATAANIDAAATFGVRLRSLPTTDNTFTVISAPTLNYTGPASATVTTSYLYDGTFNFSPAAGTVTLDLHRRTASELGLSQSESDSINGVFAGLAKNPNLLAAALLPTDKASFQAVYDQLLPDHSGGLFLAAQLAAQSIGQAATDPRSTDIGPGLWTQEFAIGLEQDRDAAVPSQATGFGISGGAETGDAGFGQLGVSAAFVNATSQDPDLAVDSQASFSEIEGGVYWRADYGHLKLSARAGGGYLFGYDRRYISLAATDTTSAVATASKGTWNGYTLDGRVAAAYQLDFGKRWFVRPQVSADYFRMNQDGYTEHGGGDGVDLIVDSRSGDASTGTASVVFGAKFGRGDTVWRPSLELGAKDVFSGDAGVTTARFASGGQDFSLVPNSITGAGGVAKASLKIGNGGYEIYVDATGQVFDKYREGHVQVGARLLF